MPISYRKRGCFIFATDAFEEALNAILMKLSPTDKEMAFRKPGISRIV